MARRPNKRIQTVLALLQRTYPQAHCELRHGNAFELLVATILSAQCTDDRVNQVTPQLFARFPDAAALADADPAELEALIRSTGFFRNKAKALREASRLLVEQHGGAVPRDIEQMVALPGVARKTANVVLGTAYGIPTGVVVDTHVKRVAGRLALTQHTDPEKVERDLMAIVPPERWIDLAHQLIWHGRRICQARKPRCRECPLMPHCPAAEQFLAQRSPAS